MKHYATGFDLEPGGGLDCFPGESSSIVPSSIVSFALNRSTGKKEASIERASFSIARNGSMIYNVVGSLTSRRIND